MDERQKLKDSLLAAPRQYARTPQKEAPDQDERGAACHEDE